MTMKSCFRVAVAAALVSIPAIPVLASGEVRVGDFYKEIATLQGIPAADGAVAESGLRSLGINLPSLELTKVLTEADLVGISDAMGVHVTTHRPLAEVTHDLVNGYTRSFRMDLRRNQRTPQPRTSGSNSGGDDPHSPTRPGDNNIQGQNNNHQR